MLKSFDGQEVRLVETTQVKEGVICDVYQFVNNNSKDLGIIRIEAGCKSPRQKVLKGDKTLQIYQEGKGSLEVVRENGKTENYQYPGSIVSVEVNVGDIMQWIANEYLVYYEICYPPYLDGRFENLNE